MKDLHPAWYNHEPGETISDLSLADSLNNCFSQLEALGELLVAIKKDAVTESTLVNTGLLIINTAKEADYLIDQWHKQPSNVTQLKTG